MTDQYEYQLKLREEAEDAAEVKFLNEYADHLDDILTTAKELTINTTELLSTGYIESLENDVLIFLSVMYEVNALKFRHLPKSYRVELFQGICRDQAHDFEDYEADLMVAE